MLHGLGPRGTIGVTGQQLSDQLPKIDGTAVRSNRYGHSTFMEFDRSVVRHGYGEFKTFKNN